MKKIGKGVGAGVALVLSAGLLVVPARAADSCTVWIPVSVSVSGDTPESDTAYEVTLDAVTADAPMPENPVLTIFESGRFGPISYTVPGDYLYEVSQTSGTEEGMTYDEGVYTITVRILYGDNGALISEVWAQNDGGSEKTADVAFFNDYNDPNSREDKETSHRRSHHNATANSAVKTGDSLRLGLLWGGMLLSLAAVLFLAVMRRKRR